MADLEVGPLYLHVIIGLAVLATVTVALRLFSRWMVRGKIGIDDYWMLAAWVFMMGLAINSGFSMSTGDPYQMY